MEIMARIHYIFSAFCKETPAFVSVALLMEPLEMARAGKRQDFQNRIHIFVERYLSYDDASHPFILLLYRLFSLIILFFVDICQI